MDPELQKKIEEARAAGYTDEEINQYLATRGQPIPANEEPSRMAEMAGTGAAVGANYAPAILGGAAGLGAGALAYKYGPDVIRKGLETFNNMRGGMPSNAVYPPGSPVVGPISGAPVAQAAQAAQVAEANPTAGNFIQRMSNLARTYGPVARTAAGTAAVPAAVAGIGASLANRATNQIQAMTPEQRAQFYSSPMMGAMSGDTGFASAIMNAGQQ